MATRSKRHEVQLIVMRFLSVLLSRTKSSTKGAAQVCRQSGLCAAKPFCVPSVRFVCSPPVKNTFSPVYMCPIRCSPSGLWAVNQVFVPSIRFFLAL